jgi:hypothetical protein
MPRHADVKDHKGYFETANIAIPMKPVVRHPL